MVVEVPEAGVALNSGVDVAAPIKGVAEIIGVVVAASLEKGVSVGVGVGVGMVKTIPNLF